MKFTKMHGCGNDYVYINGLAEQIDSKRKPEIVRFLSDRHFGVGSDGVIFINPSREADFEMEMYNADGSRAEMCGNGIRCVGKYVYDKGLTDKTRLSIISAGQVKVLELIVEGAENIAEAETAPRGDVPGGHLAGGDVPGGHLAGEDVPRGHLAGEDVPEGHATRGHVARVRVNMGSPILEPGRIPVSASGRQMVDEPVMVNGREYKMTCVSMGNPHAVVFEENVRELPLEKIGPFFENHEIFPRRTNTEFVEVIDRKTVFMRVWERGSGETLACGTGCCAATVACALNGLTFDAITVKLLGGELFIEWDREENLIYMTGPAAVVFEGEIDI